MTEQSLQVRLNNKFIGVLTQDESGRLIFQYHEKTTQAVSLSLPLDKNVYRDKECIGFFNGLLPEGENIRKAIAKKYSNFIRVNPKNDFSLLKAIGYDCAGAISFNNIATNEISLYNLPLPEFFEIKGKVLTNKELEKYIRDLPEKPLALGSDGKTRLSLAGAQDKTAVVLIDNKIALPDVDIPTTHILKPAIKNIKESVENEFICLMAAKKIGIDIPNIEIREVNGLRYFLIERYDREIKDNKLKRIHQEDFCQAKNIASAYKYESDGGVNFKDCFDILKQTSRPAVSIVKFLNLMIFNYLIGNNDAHGKNFSILHLEKGKIELAPAYDILCTQIYNDLSKTMAMKIGGYYEPEKIYPRHFERFSKDVGISYPQLKKIIKKQVFTLPTIVTEIVESFENEIGTEILNVINKNCQRLINRFEF